MWEIILVRRVVVEQKERGVRWARICTLATQPSGHTSLRELIGLPEPVFPQL